MDKINIKKVAVIGSGIMGSRIACHLSNIGLSVILLDICPTELNEKESPRLVWGSKILSALGVKNIIKNNGIKIYGNPELKVSRNITIKNYLKDHRVFMTSVVAALCFGGNWKIHDKNSINTSFPSFLDKLKLLGLKI